MSKKYVRASVIQWMEQYPQTFAALTIQVGSTSQLLCKILNVTTVSRCCLDHELPQQLQLFLK